MRPTRNLIFPHKKTQRFAGLVCGSVVAKTKRQRKKERSLIEITTANQSKIKWSTGNKMCTVHSLWYFPVWLSNQIKRLLAVCHLWMDCGKNHLMSIFQIAFNCVQWYFYHIIHLRYMFNVQCWLYRSHTLNSSCINITHILKQ